MPLPATLNETTQAQLDDLVTTAAPENQHRDYKRDLPTAWNDEAKKRFIADVVAMANASGGEVIYGVDEDGNACARAVVPQVLASADAEVRRLQDFIMEYAEPRLPGVQVHPVPVTVAGKSGHAIVIRVPQSWSGPHRSRLTQHFSVREGLRNRVLDVREVGAAFRGSATRVEWLRYLRVERLAKIAAGQTPVRLSDRPRLVVHAVSTQAALELAFIDPVPYARNDRTLPCLGSNYTNGVGINLDGAFGEKPGGRPAEGYTQQFRAGYFESVDELTPFGDVREPVLASIAWEREVNAFLGKARAEFAAADVSQEMVVFISLLGADKTVFAGPSEFGLGGHSLKRFDRQDVLIPDVVIEPDVSIGRGVRPAFDRMCQAAGYLGSANYGADGEWKSSQ